MAFTVPSREQIFALFSSDYASAQPSKNISRGSDPYRLGRVISGTAWVIASKLLFFVKQMLPDTAEAEYLERWGTVYSFPRLAAVGATGELALTVTGTPAAAVTVGSELSHADGTLYEVTSLAAVIGGGGDVEVSIAATSTGLATNKIAGETLTFTSPPTDVDALATLALPLTGGLDIESYDAYRVRLLAHIGDPPEGGAFHDYIEWALRITGNSSAYVWAHRRGMGTIDVAVLGPGTGAARVPNSTVLGDTDDYIESVRPGNVRDWLLLETTTQTQDVECTIEIDETLYAWDWDDAGVGYAISAPNEGASTITVTTAPASVVAGVRITVMGEEARVTDRTGNVLTLSFEDDYDGNPVTWFTFTVTTQDIRASGDLVRPVRDAIMALFNTLGPARSDYAGTSWIAELKRSKLFGAITDVSGVDDAVLTTPATNVVPVDTYGVTIPFLIPGYIKIWKPA